MSRAAELFELVKVSGILTSIIGAGYGAHISIRGEIAESEKRLREDFRSDLAGMESRMRALHKECLEQATRRN